MKVGGVQKSLGNLLWTVHNEYDITLCLFSRRGAYIDDLPPDIKVIEVEGPFRYLGISQGECKKSLGDTIKRGALALISRIFGRKKAIDLMLKHEHKLPDSYDCAIAFLHNGREKSFYGGVQEYVLKQVKASRKIAYLHCDYTLCGADNEYNNRMIEQFDKIAACSEGCKRAFLSVLSHLESKCIAVPNCHRYEKIRKMAETDPITYDNDRINLLCVSRLSHEKGIERAITACADALDKGFPVTLHLVGDGAMKQELQALANERKISEYVLFHGEQSNPYRYMKNADLLLLTSYHEAAPMVIDEALSVGLPVFATKTTTSYEMVTKREGGAVCENELTAIQKALKSLLSDPEALRKLSDNLKARANECDNKKAKEAFCIAVTGENQ